MLRSSIRLRTLLRTQSTRRFVATTPPSLAAAMSTAPLPDVQTLKLDDMTADLPRHPLSEVPAMKHPDAFVRTAACLIIGDETKDTNSNFLAKFLFDLAIDLKRIEVIADDEEEIVEAVRRMSENYDLVITSGGIGPTHDDITYSSIAKAFDAELAYDDETIRRMETLSKRRYNLTDQTEEQKTARLRMALFPVGAEVLFVREELWVPVVRVAGKVCILPGVPSLFQQLLTGLGSRFIPLPPSSEKPFRLLVHTEMPESSIAPFLTKLQEKVKGENIRVGSYPKLHAGVDVSLIGKDNDRLKELGEEVIAELKGTLVLEGQLGEEKEVKTAKM